MFNALLRDLTLLDFVAVTTTHDARLAATVQGSVAIDYEADCWSIWAQLIKKADAVWLIAPESGGILLKLTQLCLQLNKPIIGCNDLNTIAIASSKYATFKALYSCRILTIPTVLYDDDWSGFKNSSTGLIVKPDDGVGCEGVAHFDTACELQRYLDLYQLKSDNNQLPACQLVIQPYQVGVAASMCLLCKDSQTWLLSCNTQLIVRENEKLMLEGVIINDRASDWCAFNTVAQQIVQALPTLRGFIGVDMIVNNDEIIVVEINPRLTSSYVGLSQAMQYNAAELVLNCLLLENFEMPIIAKNHVELRL